MEHDNAVKVDGEELLRVLSMYGPLPKEQFLALFSNSSAAEAMVARLRKSLRIAVAPDGSLSLAPGGSAPNPDIVLAVWVLVSFMGRVAYHTVSDYPAILTFFSESEVFEVMVVHAGQETMFNHAIWCLRDETPPRRIVVVDEPEQAQNLKIPNTAGFCTVSTDGDVSFFQLTRGDT